MLSPSSIDRAGREFWNQRWSGLPPIAPYEGPVFEQHPVLERYLRGPRGRTAIEIGCVPGNFLLYLAKEFGYEVSGIDYSDRIEYTRSNLQFNGVNVNLYQQDFFAFDSAERFDLVFSSGFVEHFTDHRLVLAKHAGLTKRAGLVVIMVPNLTHIHRVLCSAFDHANFASHVLTLMDRKTLRAALEEAGLEVLHCDFQKTFRPVYRLPLPLSLACRAVQKLLRITSLDDVGNQFGSPYLISVSRKAA